MACELSNFDHAGVLPQAKLVLAEAMAAENLSLMPAPLQRAHLGCCIYGIEHSPSVRVCELDASVSCASTRGQQIALKWTPRQCFYCSLMRSDTVRGPLIVGIPDVQQIVIATACQLLPIW